MYFKLVALIYKNGIIIILIHILESSDLSLLYKSVIVDVFYIIFI